MNEDGGFTSGAGRVDVGREAEDGPTGGVVGALLDLLEPLQVHLVLGGFQVARQFDVLILDLLDGTAAKTTSHRCVVGPLCRSTHFHRGGRAVPVGHLLERREQRHFYAVEEQTSLEEPVGHVDSAGQQSLQLEKKTKQKNIGHVSAIGFFLDRKAHVEVVGQVESLADAAQLERHAVELFVLDEHQVGRHDAAARRLLDAAQHLQRLHRRLRLRHALDGRLGQIDIEIRLHG